MPCHAKHPLLHATIMRPTDERIAEIAELLDAGPICYFHRPTGAIESLPDPNGPYFEPEPWQEVIDKVESDWSNYERFEKMSSREGFEVMEDFAHALAETDPRFRDRLLRILSQRKPFRNFKDLVESSRYREDWFAFKHQAYIEFEKRQLGPEAQRHGSRQQVPQRL